MNAVAEIDFQELDLFREMVVRFLEQEALPFYDEWEAAHLMPREFRTKWVKPACYA